jgi:flagellar hook-associated protein 2
MKPFVETGGIIAQKRQTLSSQMERQKRSIETMDEQLSRKEAELKRKYGQMEGALDQMQKASKSLDSFNNKNN